MWHLRLAPCRDGVFVSSRCTFECYSSKNAGIISNSRLFPVLGITINCSTLFSGDVPSVKSPRLADERLIVGSKCFDRFHQRRLPETEKCSWCQQLVQFLRIGTCLRDKRVASWRPVTYPIPFTPSSSVCPTSIAVSAASHLRPSITIDIVLGLSSSLAAVQRTAVRSSQSWNRASGPITHEYTNCRFHQNTCRVIAERSGSHGGCCVQELERTAAKCDKVELFCSDTSVRMTPQLKDNKKLLSAVCARGLRADE